MKATEIPHDDGLIFGLRAMAPALLGKPVEQISPAELKKLSRMSHAGQLPTRKIGGVWVTTRDALEKMKASFSDMVS